MVKQTIDQVFEVGKRYTIFEISSMMAWTTKREIKVVALEDDGDPVFVFRGKRKKYVMPLRTRAYSSAPIKEFAGAVFDGWDQPITCDTAVGTCFRGNACYNFVGSVDEIRNWIVRDQINPNFDCSKVLAVGLSDLNTPEQMVFPGDYKGGHAVLDRILAKNEADMCELTEGKRYV